MSAIIREFVAENWEWQTASPSSPTTTTTTTLTTQTTTTLPGASESSPGSTGSTGSTGATPGGFGSTTTTTLAQCPSGNVYSSIGFTNAPTGIYPPNEITTSGIVTNNSGTTVYVSGLGFIADNSDGSSGEGQVAIGKGIPGDQPHGRLVALQRTLKPVP